MRTGTPETLDAPNECRSGSCHGSSSRCSESISALCAGKGDVNRSRSGNRERTGQIDALADFVATVSRNGRSCPLPPVTIMFSPGDSWPNPSHITYSIAPDGVFWDHGINNLNATFNAKFGTSGIWERQIALALATWESVANINIVPVADGPYDLNTLGLAQGDPRFGDIRFGGYAFPDTTITLAQTCFPPPNGSTAAGDVELNTSMNFNIGSTYDFTASSCTRRATRWG